MLHKPIFVGNWSSSDIINIDIDMVLLVSIRVKIITYVKNTYKHVIIKSETLISVITVIIALKTMITTENRTRWKPQMKKKTH